jgi:3-methyl-2-oxobutanoate hydroxymethyltransferase
MIDSVAAEITSKLDIPTIGIGSGTACDGQVQVVTDILGIGSFTPKHAKRFAQIGELMQQAMKSYADEVRNGTFPGAENTFTK